MPPMRLPHLLRGGAVVVALVIAPASASASTFEYLGSFGSPGNTDGQFVAANSATIASNGQIYVSDSSRNRVTSFTYTGALTGGIGTPGSGNGQFNSPRGLTTADNGNALYVVDSGNNRVQQFALAGGYVSQFGTAGTGNAQFASPNGAATDGTWLYVSDTGNNRIQKFSFTGTYVRQWAALGTSPLAADTGTVMTSLTGGVYPTLQAYSPFGDTGASTSAGGDLARVGGIARAQRDGGFWAAVDDNQGRALLRRYTANADIAQEIPLTGAAAIDPGQAPGLASDCRGTVVVVDRFGQRVLRFGDPAAPPPPCSAPSSAASVPSLSFGTQRVSTVGAPQTASLTAAGNGIDVSRVRVTGPDADAFLISRDGCSDMTAWPGVPCGVSVRFAPTAVADATATLEFRDATTQVTRTVALSGTGAPEPSVGPGPAGTTGATGATGARGPQGAAAKVTCTVRLVTPKAKKGSRAPKPTAKVTCTVRAAAARLGVVRGGRTYARGAGRGTVTLSTLRPLRAGSYRVTITDPRGVRHVALRVVRR